jgi:transposase-like protein
MGMNAKRVTKRIKPTYDDQFRASAVVMLKSQGYPEMNGALSLVAKHLKVPASTLSRWFKGTSNPPPSNIVNEKKDDLRTLYENEIYAIMKVLPDKRDDASYGTLASAQGIFFDKIRLLDGLPTEIVQILPDLVDELEKGGAKASDVFRNMLTKARAANAQR